MEVHKQLTILLLLLMLTNHTIFAQWTKTSGPPGVNVNVLFDTDSLLFAGTSSKGVFKSMDHGATWTAANKSLANASVFSFAKDQQFLYAGTDKGVFRSSNNGATWAAANNGITIKVIDSAKVFIGNSQGIFFSNNCGNSFTNVSTGLAPSPNHSVEGLAANNSFLFAGLFINGVWRRPLSDFGILPALAENNSNTSLQKVPEADYKSSISIYPVPARDKVTISCNIKNPEKYSYSLQTCLGKRLGNGTKQQLVACI